MKFFILHSQFLIWFLLECFLVTSLFPAFAETSAGRPAYALGSEKELLRQRAARGDSAEEIRKEFDSSKDGGRRGILRPADAIRKFRDPKMTKKPQGTLLETFGRLTQVQIEDAISSGRIKVVLSRPSEVQLFLRSERNEAAQDGAARKEKSEQRVYTISEETQREIGKFAETADEARLFAIIADLEKRLGEQDQTIKELLEKSSFDPLTRLRNRDFYNKFIRDLLSLSERTGFPVSIIVVDIDRFKEINDLSGHDVGDKILQYVAGYLQKSAERDTDLVASIAIPEREASRYGGDEFIIALPGTDAAGAFKVAERIRHAVKAGKRPIAVRGTDARTGEITDNRELTVSLGIATFDPTSKENWPIDIEERTALLFKIADQALYKAKERHDHVEALSVNDYLGAKDGEGKESLRSEVVRERLIRRYAAQDPLSLIRRVKHQILLAKDIYADKLKEAERIEDQNTYLDSFEKLSEALEGVIVAEHLAKTIHARDAAREKMERLRALRHLFRGIDLAQTVDKTIGLPGELPVGQLFWNRELREFVFHGTDDSINVQERREAVWPPAEITKIISSLQRSHPSWFGQAVDWIMQSELPSTQREKWLGFLDYVGIWMTDGTLEESEKAESLKRLSNSFRLGASDLVIMNQMVEKMTANNKTKDGGEKREEHYLTLEEIERFKKIEEKYVALQWAYTFHPPSEWYVFLKQEEALETDRLYTEMDWKDQIRFFVYVDRLLSRVSRKKKPKDKADEEKLIAILKKEHISEHLLELAESKDLEVRIFAVTHLPDVKLGMELRQKAITLLEAFIADQSQGNDKLREIAVYSLSELDPERPASYSESIAARKGESQSVKQAVKRVVQGRSRSARDGGVREIQEIMEEVRSKRLGPAEAVQQLGQVPSSELSDLRVFLDDKNPDVRTVAIKALGELSDLRIFFDLFTILLSERRIEARQAAAEALGKWIQKPDALPFLFHHLQSEMTPKEYVPFFRILTLKAISEKFAISKRIPRDLAPTAKSYIELRFSRTILDKLLLRNDEEKKEKPLRLEDLDNLKVRGILQEYLQELNRNIQKTENQFKKAPSIGGKLYVKGAQPEDESLLQLYATLFDASTFRETGYFVAVPHLVLPYAQSYKTQAEFISLFSDLLLPVRVLEARYDLQVTFEGRRTDLAKYIALVRIILSPFPYDLDDFYQSLMGYTTPMIYNQKGTAPRTDFLAERVVGKSLILEEENLLTKPLLFDALAQLQLLTAALKAYEDDKEGKPMTHEEKQLAQIWAGFQREFTALPQIQGYPFFKPLLGTWWVREDPKARYGFRINDAILPYIRSLEEMKWDKIQGEHPTFSREGIDLIDAMPPLLKPKLLAIEKILVASASDGGRRYFGPEGMRIERLTEENHGDIFNDWDEDPAEIERILGQGVSKIALVGGKSVGYYANVIDRDAATGTSYIYLSFLSTREEFLRQGAGRALLFATAKEAIARQIPLLKGQVHLSNTASLKLVEASGLQREDLVNEHWNFSADPKTVVQTILTGYLEHLRNENVQTISVEIEGSAPQKLSLAHAERLVGNGSLDYDLPTGKWTLKQSAPDGGRRKGVAERKLGKATYVWTHQKRLQQVDDYMMELVGGRPIRRMIDFGIGALVEDPYNTVVGPSATFFELEQKLHQTDTAIELIGIDNRADVVEVNQEHIATQRTSDPNAFTNTEILSGSFLEPVRRYPAQVDLIRAMNVFQHYEKKSERIKARTLLGQALREGGFLIEGQESLFVTYEKRGRKLVPITLHYQETPAPSFILHAATLILDLDAAKMPHFTTFWEDLRAATIWQDTLMTDFLRDKGYALIARPNGLVSVSLELPRAPDGGRRAAPLLPSRHHQDAILYP